MKIKSIKHGTYICDLQRLSLVHVLESYTVHMHFALILNGYKARTCDDSRPNGQFPINFIVCPTTVPYKKNWHHYVSENVA